MNTTRPHPGAGASGAEPAQAAGQADAAGRWSPQRIRALGVVTDLVTAGQILGLSRNTAYTLARHNQFPTPVIRVGRGYRVAVAHLLAAVGLPAEPPADADLDPAGAPSVDHTGDKPAANQPEGPPWPTK